MNDAIRNAIDKAARDFCFSPDGHDCEACIDPAQCCRSAIFTATAISVVATFLDALPKDTIFNGGGLATAVRECRV